MTLRTLRIPGALKHTSDEQTDVVLQEKARAHADRHPGVHFLADILRALHGPPAPLRNAKTFFSTFTPREVMEAFAQRPDLRVKMVKAITGSPAALLRRLSPDALASQIDLLAIDDLPEAERSVRAEADRSLSVHDLYFRYLDPVDIAIYMPAQSIWRYESHDDWWRSEANPGARALMAAELKSIRRHAILTDSEILDLLGDETLERHLSLAVRTHLRVAARRAAADGRPFTDSDLFAALEAATGGARDLIDEMLQSVPLKQLREIVVHVAVVLGLSEPEASLQSTSDATDNASAVPIPVTNPRVGSKPTPAAVPGPSSRPPLPGSTYRGTAPPPRSLPRAPGARIERPGANGIDADAPPQPDDDLALVEEVSGRI